MLDMISIEERPKEVEDRTIPGHWEGDLIIGKGHGSAIGTLVERTTRFTILVPLKRKDARSVREAFAREFKRLPEQVRQSMTYDQGTEMSEHRLFTKSTKMMVYFAHPHSPWERGTNENTNMLVRDFFPKGTDFKDISRYKIKKVQDLLNTRPRKVINWKFPVDAFNKILEDST
jgi:IS30 family transposase